MTDTKRISDYLHLYKGCKVVDVREGMTEEEIWETEAELMGVVENQAHLLHDATGSAGRAYIGHYSKYIKPILRPLSDITEEDFYSFFSTTDDYILVKATINRLWCAGHYDKKEYDERVAEELPVDSVDLIYDLEEADHANVFSSTKQGDLAHGCSDEMRWFMDIETLAAWHTHLRKRGIDVDGLIKSGLAIDKTKPTQP